MYAGARGETNPNVSWLGSRGVWLSYVVGVTALHLALLAVPVISVATAWTLTNIIHNTLNFVLMHGVKGAPWEDGDQGGCHTLSQWEQIDGGRQNTPTKTFLTAVPVTLFILTSFYTAYDTSHFVVNFVSLLFALVPKLPFVHQRRPPSADDD
ncbi:ORM1-like protein 3 [Pollicipes pollicipes]|uniref:ORM1-like protein 3 n=1 Tax=Pollicipes pollicipes TaxID=41117 RepID=UPI001884FE60|nr:ORM1-like protein 3 [Pollicipes pollicipes]XP_037088640.1 ORM1-like protein 3 [Pollicipes pollicipes]XP_037088641.1 ORM1-like protein 3 [Pollicipes pollicipes]XP_037088642.1 ORM1-like protein 3 [Pollicipes pollicipes]XP_037088643.1 ORM1-like protein 3 [Pollicipes pollicipes]